jgi:hypothetical protein
METIPTGTASSLQAVPVTQFLQKGRIVPYILQVVLADVSYGDGEATAGKQRSIGQECKSPRTNGAPTSRTTGFGEIACADRYAADKLPQWIAGRDVNFAFKFTPMAQQVREELLRTFPVQELIGQVFPAPPGDQSGETNTVDPFAVAGLEHRSDLVHVELAHGH